MLDLLRVMITDEDLDSRLQARQAVQRAELEVVAETGYGTEAVSIAVEASPDLIFIAVEEPSVRALETAEALANALPDTPIVIYSSVRTPEAVRRGMVFGARDYVMKPLSGERISECVSLTLDREERRQMRRAGQLVSIQGRGTVITVTGAKGGVGKSVLTVNLATALRRETGRSVIVVDADTHFGDVATMLDLEPERTLEDVVARLDTVERGDLRSFVTSHHTGVDVLATPLDEADPWATITSDDLRRVIDLYAQLYDFVVVDTSGAFDGLVRACVDSAALTIVVTSSDVSSVRDTTRAVRRLDRWEIDPDRTRFVLNRSTQSNGITADELSAAIQRRVYVELPHDRAVPTSVQVGQPVVLLSAKSGAGTVITNLARRVAGVESGAGEDVPVWRRMLLRKGTSNHESDTHVAAGLRRG